MSDRVDAVVVGAGPAGSTAALQLARAGRSVVLVERGRAPGTKNMYGGVIYGRVLDGVVADWAARAPLQRWVTRRSTMVLTPTQAVTLDVRSAAWGEPPYNGATAYRSDFDRWLAEEAVAAGAILLPSTVVTGLLRDQAGRVVGVRTDRPDGDLRCEVVIACDGVNSLLAKEAGLHRATSSDTYTLGVKEVLALPRATIEQRFGVTGRHGVDIEILGATGQVPGGGFVYTNLETVAVGVVAQVSGLAKAKVRPEELVARLRAHPAVAALTHGGELVEYSAHLIPEGGYDSMPALSTDGMLVAGDAAHMTLAAGIWLEGVNMAIGAGSAAGLTAARALAAGDTSEHGLRGYRQALESSFVLANHRRLRNLPHLVLGERTQRVYPGLICDLAEELFTVRDPIPKPGLTRLALDARRRHGVRWRDLASDGLSALRALR